MVKMLVRDPNLKTLIPVELEASHPFRIHVILRGSSPSITRQFCCTIFPAFTAMSPNENGAIAGKTVIKQKLLHCQMWRYS
jgi:hypothetical protein